MFLCNKWAECYERLMEKAKNRPAMPGYLEKHHILPKSCGGSNDKANIVCLTAREHLIAHKLLIRFSEANTKKKMLGGLWAMAALRKNNKRTLVSSREFAKIRELYFQSRRGISISAYTKKQISKALMGRKIPDEIITKRSKTLRNNIAAGKTILAKRKLSEEQKKIRREKLIISMPLEKWAITVQKTKHTKQQWTEEQKAAYSLKLSTANTGKKRTITQKQNISAGLCGRVLSEDTKQKISIAQRGRTKEARLVFLLQDPSGKQVSLNAKAADVAYFIGTGVKYLYLSFKNKCPIKKGRAAGWMLVEITRPATVT